MNDAKELLHELKKYITLEAIAGEIEKGYMTVYRWYLGKGKPCKAEFLLLQGLLLTAQKQKRRKNES